MALLGMVPPGTLAEDPAASFVPVLTELASLRDEESTSVGLEARRLLIEHSLPSREEQQAKVGAALERAARTAPGPDRDRVIAEFVHSGVPMRTVVVQFLKSAATRAAAMEMYVTKIYEAQQVSDFRTSTLQHNATVGTWSFHAKRRRLNPR